MATYRGKMNWGAKTTNESFTVVLPQGNSVRDGVRENDPIHLYWKWSKGDHVFCQTVIYNVTGTTRQGETQFSCIYNNRYILDITSRKSGDELAIVMYDDTQSDKVLENARSLSLKKVRYDPELQDLRSGKHIKVYAGLFDFVDWAVEEVFVLVLPKGWGDGLPVSAHSQWAKDPTTDADSTSNRPKKNIQFDTLTSEQKQQFYLRVAPNTSNNKFEFDFKGQYHIWVKKTEDARTLSVDLSKNDGSQDGLELKTFKLRLQPTYFNNGITPGSTTPEPEDTTTTTITTTTTTTTTTTNTSGKPTTTTTNTSGKP